MTDRDAVPKCHVGLLLAALAIVAGSLWGCATPTNQGPWLVSKPSMQFSEARAFNAPNRVGFQLEPGRVVSGGAQASVCTSCR
jgi:hypothetical protein